MRHAHHRLPLALLAAFGALALAAAPALGQSTVRDSVKMTRGVYSWHRTNSLGGTDCGAYIYATWPDVLVDLGLPGGYSRYSRVAVGGTSAHYVPTGYGQATHDPSRNLIVPAGYLAHAPQLGGHSSGPGPGDGCAERLAGVQGSVGGGPMGILNARPFQITDWYAVFTVPGGMPIALFTWKQTRGLDVAFDGSFESKQSRETDPTAPGGKRPVVAYDWDFGDGHSGSGSRPTHTYEDAGTYAVSLTVTDDDGERRTRRDSVVVRDGVLSVRVRTERTPRTAGDTLALVATVTNTGNTGVYNVSARRVFSSPVSYPTRADTPGDRFRAPELEQVGEKALVTRGLLAEGDSFTVRAEYRVKTIATFQAANTSGYVPILAELRSSLSQVTAEASDGSPVKVTDDCEGGGCPNVTEVRPAEAKLERALRVAQDSVGVQDTLEVRVVVRNTGDFDVTNVVPGAAPTVENVRYPALPPRGDDQYLAPDLVALGGPEPASVAALAKGDTAAFAYRYLVRKAATWSYSGERDRYFFPIPATVRYAPGGGAKGVYNGNDVLAGNGCGGGPCRDSVVVQPERLTIEVEARTVDGVVTSVRTGLTHDAALADDFRGVQFVEHRDGTPLCKTGCVDVTVTVTDAKDVPVEGLEVAVRGTLSARLDGTEGGGFVCERRPNGERMRCDEKYRTDAEGKIRVWYAVPGVIEDTPFSVEASVETATLSSQTGRASLTALANPVYDASHQPNLVSIAFAATANLTSNVAGALNLGEYCENAAKYARDAAGPSGYGSTVSVTKTNVPIAWLCSVAPAALTLAGPVGAGAALLVEAVGAVVDPVKKVADAAQYTRFASSFGLGASARHFVDLAWPQPPPLPVGLDGDMLDFATEAVGNVAFQAPAVYRLEFHEVSAMFQPPAADAPEYFKQVTYHENALHARLTGGGINQEAVVRRRYTADYWLAERAGWSDATTAAPADPDDTTLDVAAYDGRDGDLVLVDGGDAAEVNQVTAVESTPAPAGKSAAGVRLHLARPLRRAHPAGAPIVRLDSGVVAPPPPPLLIPVLDAPPPRALAWADLTGLGAAFDVQVARDTAFSALVVAFEGVTAGEVAVDTALFARGTAYAWRVRARNAVGTGAWSRANVFTPGQGRVVAAESAGPAVARVALGAVYPNPSRGAVAVPFELPTAGAVRLAVHDALGREVAVLVDGARPAGRHAASVGAGALPAGVYFVRLAAGGAVETRPLVVVR